MPNYEIKLNNKLQQNQTWNEVQRDMIYSEQWVCGEVEQLEEVEEIAGEGTLKLSEKDP